MHPGILAAIVSVAVFAVTLGLSYPLFSLLLEQMGLSSTMIGLSAAMTPLGILASSPLMPAVVRAIGPLRLNLFALVAIAVLFAATGLFQDPYLWFAFRFLLGATINVPFVISETWINELAGSHVRGRVMGVYATVVSAGFAGGPLALAFTGTEGMLPFGLAIAATLAAIPVLLAARSHLPAASAPTPEGIWSFARAAPVLLVAVAAFALFDQVTLSLLPIYSLRIGFSEAQASMALAVLVAGSIALQMPIGMLADWLPRRLVLGGLATLAGLGAMIMPLAVPQPWLYWTLLFVWGAAGYGGYVVALAVLGDRFTGTLLLAGNAAFAMMWGVSGIVGAPVAGAAMTVFGHNGLPWVLAAVFVAMTGLLVAVPLVRHPQPASSDARQA